MRMIEAKQLEAELARPRFRETVVGRPNQKAPPRTFLGRVRQRHDAADMTVASDERAAALVRIRLLAVPPDSYIDCR